MGVACHVAAIVQSVLSWRRGGGVPGVALSYLALPVLWAAWAAYGRYAEARLYRDNPGMISAEPSRDGLGLDVRDARGVWRVPLDACPNALGPRDEIGTSGHDGVVEVLNPDGAAYMRLRVAERRAECVPGPPRRATGQWVNATSPSLPSACLSPIRWSRPLDLVCLAPCGSPPPGSSCSAPRSGSG